MLTRSDFLSLNFVKKEDFTGSHQGMRFLLRCETVEDEKKLKVFLWGEPYVLMPRQRSKKYPLYFLLMKKGCIKRLIG